MKPTTSMRIRASLKAFAAGVLLTAAVAMLETWGINTRWEQDVYQHGSGCFTFNAKDAKLRPVFHWWNDCAQFVPPKAKQATNREWVNL
jgi:hypothetical protein